MRQCRRISVSGRAHCCIRNQPFLVHVVSSSLRLEVVRLLRLKCEIPRPCYRIGDRSVAVTGTDNI